MKRLLDSLLSRWYVPAERYTDVVNGYIKQRRIVVEVLAEAQRIVQEATANQASPSVLVTGLSRARDKRSLRQS